MSQTSPFDELKELIPAQLDGTISLSQYDRLRSILTRHPECHGYYAEYIVLCAALNRYGKSSLLPGSKKTSDDCRDILLWTLLAEEEKTAPTFEISEPEPLSVQPVITQIPVRKTGRSILVRAIIYSAALIMLLVLTNLYQRTPQDAEVATLTAQVNAFWADSVHIENGWRFMTSDAPMRIEKGVITLGFDSGAVVTIESPAQFQVVAANQINLSYGHLFADVGGAEDGFVVETDQSRILDVGTQFGVRVNQRGETELHVFEGRTILIGNPQSSDSVSVDVTAGQARRMSHSGSIQNIPLKNHDFARAIGRRSDLVWRGENISLADIVGGGNGFGTGRQDYGIIIATGKPSQEALSITGHGHLIEKEWDQFCTIPEIGGIDGIFIPDGGSGPVMISSKGHQFENCPDTNAHWSGPITNGARSTDRAFQLAVDNVSYGTPDNPALFMHANSGITYDLSAVRAALPAGQSFTRFVSLVVAPTNPINDTSLIDVWILVDGQVRFSKTNIPQSQSFTVDIPISEKESFLSLVVTDGIDDGPEQLGTKNNFDWCFFCRPELVVTEN